MFSGHCMKSHRSAEKLFALGKKTLKLLRQNINWSLISEMCIIIKTTHLLALASGLRWSECPMHWKAVGSILSQVEASSGGGGEGEGMTDVLVTSMFLSLQKSMKICPPLRIKKQTTHLLREFYLFKSLNRILVINKFGKFSGLVKLAN